MIFINAKIDLTLTAVLTALLCGCSGNNVMANSGDIGIVSFSAQLSTSEVTAITTYVQYNTDEKNSAVNVDRPDFEYDTEGNFTPESSFEYFLKIYMNEEDITTEFLSETEINIIFDRDLDEREYYGLFNILDIMAHDFYTNYELKCFIKTPNEEKEYTPDKTIDMQ